MKAFNIEHHPYYLGLSQKELEALVKFIGKTSINDVLDRGCTKEEERIIDEIWRRLRKYTVLK